MSPSASDRDFAPDSTALATAIKQKARSLGFHQVGIAAVEDFPATAPQALQAWLEQGYQAEMQWMANPKRQAIQAIMPDVVSVICVALNYYAPAQRPDSHEYGKISRYAWGRDYHRVLQKRLKALAAWLETQRSQAAVRYYVDTGPIQDKAWAEHAGLGWIGKHGNLITRQYGSWVFLGELLTNVALPPDRPHTAHCGTCTRCLAACPTQAIVAPFVVDANRCLAYHTIENRAATLPQTIAQNLQGWVAGCDVCQDVCPWNQRFAQPTDIDDFQPRDWTVAPRLDTLATLSEAEYEEHLTGSALRRVKPWMLRRNAQAALDYS